MKLNEMDFECISECEWQAKNNNNVIVLYIFKDNSSIGHIRTKNKDGWTLEYDSGLKQSYKDVLELIAQHFIERNKIMKSKNENKYEKLGQTQPETKTIILNEQNLLNNEIERDFLLSIFKEGKTNNIFNAIENIDVYQNNNILN